MRSLLVLTLLLCQISMAQVRLNLPDIATLKVTPGSVGRNALVATTAQEFQWIPAGVTDNNVTSFTVTGIPVGGWQAIMGSSGSMPLSTSLISGTSEVTVVTTTIKGGVLGTNRDISYRLLVKVNTAISTLTTITIRVKYGTGVITLASGVLLGSLLSNKSAIIRGNIFNTNATNAQAGYAELAQSTGVLGSSGTLLEEGVMAIDSSVDQPFSITIQLGGVVGSTVVTASGANIK